MSDIPLTKSGKPDKRYKATQQNAENRAVEALPQAKQSKKNPLHRNYDFVLYEDLESKVIDMGDYLLLIPPVKEKFIKIEKVHND